MARGDRRCADQLWSVDLFRAESILLKSYWVLVVMDVFSRRIIGFAGVAANLDGTWSAGCSIRRSRNRSCRGDLPSDHDPLFRYQRWRANLRSRDRSDQNDSKYPSLSPLYRVTNRDHPARVSGSNLLLEPKCLHRKLKAYQSFYNQHRCHTGLGGLTRARQSGAPAPPFASLTSYRWRRHCGGLFQIPIGA